MKNKKLTLFFILACCFSFAGQSQTLPLVNYTIQNGLPEATVYAVYIDQSGYLWVGTQGGVASFDGRQFHVYDSQAGLPDNHITSITSTDAGLICLGDHAGSLSFCQNNTITRFQHRDFTNNKIIGSMLWQNHSLYLATRGNGLFCITFFKIGYNVKHFTVSQRLLSDTINQLVVKNKTEIWLATSKGLSVFNTESNVPEAVHFPAVLQQNITSVYQQAGGSVWCGTNTGVIYFKPENPQRSLKKITLSQGLVDQHINKIKADHNNNIWLATNNGVAKISGETATCFTKTNGLLSEAVYDLIEDREHNIWIGQDDGVSCYKNSPFELYTIQDGLVYNEVYSIIEDSRNNFWVGTSNGISVFNTKPMLDKKIRNFTVKDGLPDDFIYKIFEDSHKNIWIACVYKGAACYLPDKKKFLVFNKANGLAGKQVVSINEDKKGRVWLATLDSGVAVYNYDKKKMQTYKTGSGSVSNTFWTIHRDARGQLWFGSRDKGLVYLDTLTDRFMVVPGQQKLSNHNFGSISSDSKGNIWIASIGGGVFKYDGKSFTQYGSRQGIKSNNPYFIFCDKADQVWLGTNEGVGLFNPGTLTIRNFLKNDGFMGIETNQNAIYQARNSDLWIGTVNGLMRYQFNKNAENIPAPLVYITKKNLLYEEEGLQRNKLNYQENNISFDYLGISLSNADKICYSSRLDGFDQKWSPLSVETKISYANLPPGKYAFMVKAGYKGGNWSAPVKYAFIISPPFFKTWWFILLACAAIYGFISAIYRYQIGQLLKIEKIRQRIATDLHDDIGSTLSNINLLSELSKKSLKDPPQAHLFLDRISEEVQESSQSLDDIIWSVNTLNDNWDETFSRMRRYAAEIFENSHTRYTIKLEEQVGMNKLNMEKRRDIYLIYKEILNNIHKHAHASDAEIEMWFEEQRLVMSIRDNGKGFDKTLPTHRNGLKNLGSRVARWKGSVTIDTGAEGTHIKIII